MAETTLSILLVEDNIAHIELIRRAYEDSIYKCDLSVSETIADATKLIQTLKPDLIITDLNLPDGRGTELILNAKHPVILMTSFGDENIAVEAIKLGALDYIVKSPDVFNEMPKFIERAMREWKNKDATQKVQEELLKKEIEQREILNAIMDGVITIDENSIILTFNSVAEKLFGYKAKEIIGVNLSLIMPESYRARHDEGLASYIKTNKTKIIGIDGGIEVEAMRKDKSLFPIRLAIGELPMDSNGVRRFIGTCQDLTQVKHQEEQLRHSQKMDALGKLTSGVAHDYNNMLGVVLGYSEILTAMLREQPKIVTMLDEITRAGNRGVKLTKKLLSFSSKGISDTEVMNLNSTLRDAQNMLEKTLTARIQLKFELEEDECLVCLDHSELEDVIVNLCINAMHAIEGNGDIVIQTHNLSLSYAEALILQLDPGNYISLSLRDSGCGMDEKTKEKMFEPFYTTKGDKGTGLGLSQVYGFVERSHGAIDIESEIGIGTLVTIYFPQYVRKQVENDINDNVEIDHTPPKNLGGTETILVVDDESGLRILAETMLREAGYHVLSAENGQQALDMLESENVDLIFSDVIMPEMDGYLLAEVVQKKYPSIKIQLVSGFHDEEMENIDNMLFENALSKPYKIEDLLIKIRNLLD